MAALRQDNEGNWYLEQDGQEIRPAGINYRTKEQLVNALQARGYDLSAIPGATPAEAEAAPAEPTTEELLQQQIQEQIQQGPPEYYQGPTVAPVTPATQQAQQSILDYISGPGSQLTQAQQQAALSAMGGVSPLQQAAMGNVPGAQQAISRAMTTAPGGIVGPQISLSPEAQQAMSSMLTPGQNPYLDRMVQGALRSGVRTAEEQVLPGIRSGAIGAGQYGGSRQGIQEGIVKRGLAEKALDVASQMYGGAYESERGRQLQALGLSGGLAGQQAQLGLGGQQLSEAQRQAVQQAQLQAAGLTQQALGAGGAQTLAQQQMGLQAAPQALASQLGLYGAGLDVGAQQQGQQQAQIQADLAQWAYESGIPLAQLQGLMGIASTYEQTYNPQNYFQQIQQPEVNPLLSALGGAATGAGVGAKIGGPSGAGVGAGIGAGLGLLGAQ